MSSHFNNKLEGRSMENRLSELYLTTIDGNFFTLIKETTEQIESNNSVFQFPNNKYNPK